MRIGAVIVTVVAGLAGNAGAARAMHGLDAAVAGAGRLAWDLVRASGSGDVIVSPVSVWEALAMTHAGARGETAAEMARLLCMPDDRAAIAGAPEAARAEINGWVGDHTARKITELLQPGVVTPLTRLVLTNAVSLKAPWATPLEEFATRPEPFHVSSDARADVPFMHQAGTLVAGTVGSGPTAATVCEIPYDGGSLAGWRAEALRPRPVQLALPKWTARKPLDLNAAIIGLGMKQAFQQGVADFSGLDGTRDLFVAAVVHEGFVGVSEEGTEAAAATGVAVAKRSAPVRDELLEVRADRPFAWVVIERGTGAALFAGVLADPRD